MARSDGSFAQRVLGRGILFGMGAVQEALQIGFCLLIAFAAVVAALIVWRDDHKQPIDGH